MWNGWQSSTETYANRPFASAMSCLVLRQCGLAGLLVLGTCAPSACAAVMTFDSLLGIFDEYSTYTENGITLFALDGSPSHFHDDFNFDNSTTGASIFSDDGSPQRIVFNGGADLFSLLSVEVWTVDMVSPVTFTSSSGAMQTISTTGIAFFGAGFADVSFVTIDVLGGGASLQFGVDNIKVSSNTTNPTIPEPSTGVVLLVLAGIAAPFLRKRSHSAE